MEPDNSSHDRPSGVDFDLNIRLNAHSEDAQKPDKETSEQTSDCTTGTDKLKDCVSSFLPELIRQNFDSSIDVLLTRIVDGLPNNRYFQLTQTDSVNKLIEAELEPTVVPKIVASEPFNRRVEAKITESAEAEFSKFRSILAWVSSSVAGTLVILGGLGYFSLRDMFTDVAKKRDQIELARQEIDKYRSDLQSQLAEFKSQAGQLTRDSTAAERNLDSTGQLASQSRQLLSDARQAVAKDTQTVFDNIANIQNQAHLAQQANASLVSASTALAKSISSGQMALDAAVHNAGTTDQQLAATLVEAKKTLTDLKESKLLQGVKTATDLANSAANKAARASVFRTLNLTTALAQKSEVDDVDNAGRRYQLIFSLGEFKDGRLPLHISLTEVGTPNTTSLEKNLITDPIFSVALPGKATDFLYCETDSPQRRRFSRSASVVLRLYAL